MGQVAAKILTAALLLAYPALVYFGLATMETRSLAAIMAVVGLIILVVRLPSASRQHLRSLVVSPAVVILLAASSAIFDAPDAMLLLPVLVNAGLLVTFGWTLRKGAMPMIERFARLLDPNLPPAVVAYTRRVTAAWCVFFVVNGAIAGALALLADLSWWALYTGVIGYAAMGSLFAVEYTIRKYLFRDYGDGLHDRFFAAIFPRRETTP